MSGWHKSLLWKRCFLNLRILHAFAPHYRFTNIELFKAFINPKFSSDKMSLCTNSDQTRFSDTLISAWDLADVNSMKIMFDPYINSKVIPTNNFFIIINTTNVSTENNTTSFNVRDVPYQGLYTIISQTYILYIIFINYKLTRKSVCDKL